MFMTRSPTLDIDLMRAFVAIADAQSFTIAGQRLGATQSAISLRLRKLEERIGARLLERNPHRVALTGFGESFLDDALRFLRAHDETALRALTRSRQRDYRLAVSDHAAGEDLPRVLAELHRLRPDLRFTVAVGSSGLLVEEYRDGRHDAVVARREEMSGAARILFQDRLEWSIGAACSWNGDEPLPLVSLAAPCGFRAIATSSLSSAGAPWREAFTGTSVAAAQAAVASGLGVACLGRRNRPHGAKPVSARLGLPALPKLAFALDARATALEDEKIAKAIEKAFKPAAKRRATAS